MSCTNVLKRRKLTFSSASNWGLTFAVSHRHLHHDGRNRLTNIWTPTQRPESSLKNPENGHDLLIRAGFLSQAHSGIFHFLPLGLKVQSKLEALIDKHMQSIGASKVSLSSISSEELWQRSGRLDKSRSSELLRLQDRRGTKYLLSPTHEEEITTIVANAVQSYKALPLRLYQVSRKYRDEPRPRQGLLRGREFLMKDLYTFDVSEDAARKTYEHVRKAYVAFFDDLGLPYLVARADSGNMGGTLSHEYHFASPQGEDTILTCDSCQLSMNEELYIGRHHSSTSAAMPRSSTDSLIETECYVSKDRQRLCSVHYSTEHGKPNIYAVKAIFPDVDTSLQGEQAKTELNQPQQSISSHLHYRDPRVPIEALAEGAGLSVSAAERAFPVPTISGEQILLTKLRQNDACPNCAQGRVNLHQAVEIGHTFHLGQHYSIPFEARVLDADGRQAHIEMGCHGIGVSRLIGAVANLLADEKGLNWPLAIAPFETVIVPGSKATTSQVDSLYDGVNNPDSLSSSTSDVLIDDRDRPLGWKLNDADLIGYPFIVVMGNAWHERGNVELQCRRRGFKQEVPVGELAAQIRQIAAGL